METKSKMVAVKGWQEAMSHDFRHRLWTQYSVTSEEETVTQNCTPQTNLEFSVMKSCKCGSGPGI